MADFIIIAVVSIALTVLADLLLSRAHISGIDFLFYGPWVAALTNGFYALVLALILTFAHAALNQRISHFIVLSFPAQIIAILVASMGAPAFWISIISYLAVAAAITALAKGFGMRFVIFLAVSFVLNAALFSAGLFL